MGEAMIEREGPIFFEPFGTADSYLKSTTCTACLARLYLDAGDAMALGHYAEVPDGMPMLCHKCADQVRASGKVKP